jgi:dolichol kinase
MRLAGQIHRFFSGAGESLLMKELIRKLLHLGLGLAIAALVLMADRAAAIAILAGGLFAGIILIDCILRGYRIPVISPLLALADRGDSLPGRGALTFAVSALFCAIIFPQTVAGAALIVLAVLDGVATIAGKRFGRTRIHHGKTVEGSAAGILAAFLCLLLLLPLPQAAAASGVAGVIELVAPIDDNLVIPPGVCLLLSIPALGT